MLIAEDETLIRLDIQQLLVAAGYDVVAAVCDGYEAVELARETKPDLAVLDVKMPRIDGIDAAVQLLSERPIPIVMVTAYGEGELVRRASAAGAFGYLTKPFRGVDLINAIELASARFCELSELQTQADSLAEALVARKAIERAKGLLMDSEKLSEAEAFARIRRASQTSGRSMREIAEMIVVTLSPTA